MTGTNAPLARTIGWASIGLGLLDWTMAQRFADGVGMTRGKAIFRAAAAREVLTGIAVVRAPGHPAPIVARLIGDLADIAILGATAARRDNPKRAMAAFGVAIVVVVSAVDLVALRRRRGGHAGGRAEQAAARS